jgi:hypothetical protein
MSHQQQYHQPGAVMQGVPAPGHLPGRQHAIPHAGAPLPGYHGAPEARAPPLPAGGGGQALNLSNSRLSELPPAVCQALACGAVSKLDISGNQVRGRVGPEKCGLVIDEQGLQVCPFCQCCVRCPHRSCSSTVCWAV